MRWDRLLLAALVVMVLSWSAACSHAQEATVPQTASPATTEPSEVTDAPDTTAVTTLGILSTNPPPLSQGVSRESSFSITLGDPLWQQLRSTMPDGDKEAHWDATELTERFRVIDTSTGESTPGTVRVLGGTRLVFEPSAPGGWAPDTDYVVMLTGSDSFEAAYVDGSAGSLFTTAFSTRSQDRGGIDVMHPFDGASPETITDVAYDVDSSSSLSYAELAAWVRDAAAKADEVNAGRELRCSTFEPFRGEDCTFDAETGTVTCSRDEENIYPIEAAWCLGEVLTRFHFWPNVINLTDVYHADDDRALFETIAEELLQYEPDAATLMANLRREARRGDRVFVARDFVSSLAFGFSHYREVHYCLLINLDARYARELLVHQYAGDGLPPLNDPHVDELQSMLDHASAGRTWDLCLRGNLKNTKYNAIVVDRLGESPDAEFFVQRMHLVCGGCCGATGTWDEEEPAFPWKPWNPLKLEPVLDLVPAPNPPLNPHQPPNPAPGPAGPFIHPWPFPVDPNTFAAPEDTIEMPGEPEQTQDQGECAPIEAACEDAPTVQEMLDAARAARLHVEQSREADGTTLEGFQWEWEANAGFNDECLNRLMERFNDRLDPLQQAMDDARADYRAKYDAKRALLDGMSELFGTLLHRGNLWANMLYVGGDWSRVRQMCPGPFIPAGGNTFEASSVDEALLIIDEETQRNWQNSLATALMGGRTWQQARESMIGDSRNYPAGVAKHDTIYQVIMNWYADCMAKSYTRSLNIFLQQMLAGDPSEAEMQELIDAMFGGETSLTPAQLTEYRAILARIESLNKEMADIANDMADLSARMAQLRSEFLNLAYRCCRAASLEEWKRAYQKEWLLESYLEWCHSEDHSTYDVKYWEDEAGIDRLCAALCEMRCSSADASTTTTGQGLCAYLDWLAACLCPEFDCTSAEPQPDPDCAGYLS